MADFRIIQGGMGIGVSNWRLAREVASRGQLGVVSGVGLAVLLARRLQLGDRDMRRAMAAFPIQSIAQNILKLYFRDESPFASLENRVQQTRFRKPPMPQIQISPTLTELTIAANFAEVYLAKEGHNGLVGINLLEKIQMPTLASLYGAMLAGVDYVLMGAGIPRFIPGALDAFAAGKPAEHRIDVAGALAGESFISRFDPADYPSFPARELIRPRFLAIVASSTLAATLARKSNGKVDGFVVELPAAGGHNAPPRGQMTLNPRGEPIYGERDVPDLAKIRELDLPFYLAGGYATPEGLAFALSSGAHGIQVGTLFAFCEESGITHNLKTRVHEMALAGQTDVYTDPLASPTGFPFKVLQVPGTLSDISVYAQRQRVCDLGYLRQAYRMESGDAGYRCPAEPIDIYVQKGGRAEETVGRKCICNGLLSTIGLGQYTLDNVAEPPILTSGDDIASITKLLKSVHGAQAAYTAADVLNYLLQSVPEQPLNPKLEIFVHPMDTNRPAIYDNRIGS